MSGRSISTAVTPVNNANGMTVSQKAVPFLNAMREKHPLFNAMMQPVDAVRAFKQAYHDRKQAHELLTEEQTLQTLSRSRLRENSRSFKKSVTASSDAPLVTMMVGTLVWAGGIIAMATATSPLVLTQLEGGAIAFFVGIGLMYLASKMAEWDRKWELAHPKFTPPYDPFHGYTGPITARYLEENFSKDSYEYRHYHDGWRY